jgi:hypothetical protein
MSDIEHKYIYPQAYLAIGNAQFNRTYRLLEAIETINHEVEHGDFSIFKDESIINNLKSQMKMTSAIMQGSYEKSMDEAIAYWKSYKSQLLKE